MKIVYAGQEAPETVSKSIFLVGPTPRKETGGESWRQSMIDALDKAGFDGVVYVPEPEDGKWPDNYDEQVMWEQKYLEQSDCILAWVPRDLKTMPAFTTNVEFGAFLASGKMIYGRPDGAPKTRYLDSIYTEKWGRAPLASVEEMAVAATNRIGPGSMRTGGERAVPLDVWKTKQFQAWYRAQTEAGNRLDDAKLLWPFYVGSKKNFLFCFTLWVKVWVQDEQRHKSNEFIFSRTDISTIVAFTSATRTGTPTTFWSDLMNTEIILVKEFRSPARTVDGFVHELPGGSSFKPTEDPLSVAAHELEEETSIRVDPSRMKMHEGRQVAGTLSTHLAVVFSVELSEDEMGRAKELARSGKHFGVEGDSEQTYVEIGTVESILSSQAVDWAQVGMLMQALSSR